MSINGQPQGIIDEICEMGKIFNDDIINRVMKLYIPIHKTTPKGDLKKTMDLAYGPDKRHLLDIYEPIDKPNDLMPIVVFFHGGGFVAGDKNAVGELVFGNIPTYFARHGMVGVNATYRLAPRHKWPEGARDVGMVVRWLKEKGAEYGGDPEKIFLLGQSAGAAHVATYICHRELQPGGAAGAAGAILMSGQYNPDPDDPGRYNSIYYGTDVKKYPERAAVNHLDGLKVPVFIIFAEFDPHDIEKQSVELLELLCKRDRHCPRVKRLVNHNHLSECVHINTEDESIGPDIIDFIKTGK